MPAPRVHHLPGRQGQVGFTVLEAVVAGVLAAVAVAGYLVSTAGAHRLAGSERVRGEGLVLAEQFIQRLRADEDWPSLYTRLRVLQDGVGPAVPGARPLDDGRTAYPPQAYFLDFVAPPDGCDAVVRVEVPAAPLDTAPVGPAVLREDLAAPRFGLPADLNADGAMDGEARDGDYVVLPVVLTWRLERPGQSPQTLMLGAWLRGDR